MLDDETEIPLTEEEVARAEGRTVVNYRCFGCIDDQSDQPGYFLLGELASVRGPICVDRGRSADL